MEMVLNDFEVLNQSEMEEVDGGGVVAAVYALGFVMGCSPLAAIGICVGVTAAAIGVGVAVSRCF